MIIAQISDTHIALDTPDSDRRIGDFERTIAAINALDPAPDLIFHTGDIVHNGRADEYATAAAILGQARAPVYVIPGNKDDRGHLRAAFARRGYISPDSPFIDYAVEDFPVRLIALDTLSTQSNKGNFCAERARRLIEMIDAETTKPIAVFAHHPPFVVPVGPDPIHFEPQEAMTRLAETLQHSDRIVGLFSGHVHRAAEGRVGKVPAVVMPCIATTLRKGDYPAAMQTRPIYYLHRYEPAWGFITEARVV
ncbi:MAG TPA: metallophosphoesterase [Pseudolabrys sp.]|nr:metallophosphoesterase [Pseudolabrys sp.]